MLEKSHECSKETSTQLSLTGEKYMQPGNPTHQHFSNLQHVAPCRNWAHFANIPLCTAEPWYVHHYSRSRGSSWTRRCSYSSVGDKFHFLLQNQATIWLLLCLVLSHVFWRDFTAFPDVITSTLWYCYYQEGLSFISLGQCELIMVYCVIYRDVTNSICIIENQLHSTRSV